MYKRQYKDSTSMKIPKYKVAALAHTLEQKAFLLLNRMYYF